MTWPLLTGLWRLVVSLPFWWLYLVKHSLMHGLCHCLELFINSMWWVYWQGAFIPHQTAAWSALSSQPYSAKQRFTDSASAEALALSCLSLLKKIIVWREGCALAKPGCPWWLTFALGRLGNHSLFVVIPCWAPWISQVQSSGLSSIFPGAQPCSCLKRAVEPGCGLSSVCSRVFSVGNT